MLSPGTILQIASAVWNCFTILLVAGGSMWLGFAFGLNRTTLWTTSFLEARAMKFRASKELLEFMSDQLIRRTVKIWIFSLLFVCVCVCSPPKLWHNFTFICTVTTTEIYYTKYSILIFSPFLTPWNFIFGCYTCNRFDKNWS